MKAVTLILLILFAQGSICLGQEAIEEEFNQYFHEYVQELRNKDDNPSSSLMDYINNEPFVKIVEMKLDALPYLIKKFESDKFGIFYKQILGIAFERISKKSMPSGQKVNERYIYYVNWWKEYKSTTKPAFDEIYENWRSHEPTEFQKILNLGIPALPYAVEKVGQGETDLTEVINYWTDDALATAVQAAGVEAENLPEFVPQWWEENREQWTLPESNTE